ncbi:acyclic terpene utilization AtuA family protein [Clostridium sp. FS41]|uniref:acyclic terpene utilization AtuA family protein n=1 Tax=Clostridia TaxID=186801 RepID=UPI0005D367B5|nr:acyclic terpene utilization AtuA family protein [Clostridium sp. FS41]KJJ65648.1 hypothetical protein CLFS41_56130 [Clostridium sp. FS41]
MNKCKVFVPYGGLGMGISEESFQRAIAMKPDIISTDAGSTDSGPYYLGAGKCKYAREAIKNDTKRMIVAAHKLHIPITIGSCGTCGVDDGVDFMEDVCREICREEGITVKVAKIYSELSRETVNEKLGSGKIKPLEPVMELDQEKVNKCSHIVGVLGAEPFIEALKNGADIVLAGRTTDTAVLACMPLLKGCSPAAAWHGAKVCECSGTCTTSPQSGGIVLTVDESGFEVESPARDSICTPFTISAHLLYENADPFYLVEPGVIVDVSEADYIQLPEGRVRVENTRIWQTSYTMKLEGAGPAGYQTITLVGIRNRIVLKDPMSWLDKLSAHADQKLGSLGYDPDSYSYSLRPYGYQAVYGGDVPEGYIPNELGVLLTVTADDQETATKIAKVFNPILLHFEVAKNTPKPSFAFPFSPAEVEKGRIYEFQLNHVIELDDPFELIRMEYVTIDGKEE